MYDSKHSRRTACVELLSKVSETDCEMCSHGVLVHRATVLRNPHRVENGGRSKTASDITYLPRSRI
jgi:hypothetical protein